MGSFAVSKRSLGQPRSHQIRADCITNTHRPFNRRPEPPSRGQLPEPEHSLLWGGCDRGVAGMDRKAKTDHPSSEWVVPLRELGLFWIRLVTGSLFPATLHRQSRPPYGPGRAGHLPHSRVFPNLLAASSSIGSGCPRPGCGQLRCRSDSVLRGAQFHAVHFSAAGQLRRASQWFFRLSQSPCRLFGSRAFSRSRTRVLESLSPAGPYRRRLRGGDLRPWDCTHRQSRRIRQFDRRVDCVRFCEPAARDRKSVV